MRAAYVTATNWNVHVSRVLKTHSDATRSRALYKRLSLSSCAVCSTCLYCGAITCLKVFGL